MEYRELRRRKNKSEEFNISLAVTQAKMKTENWSYFVTEYEKTECNVMSVSNEDTQKKKVSQMQW